MFARFSTIVPIAALVALVTAAPSELESRTGGSCNTGSNYCCNSLQSASSPSVIALAQSVGASLAGVTGQVGVTCSPITGIGVGGNSCSQQAACCTGNNYNGLIVISCTPVNIAP